MCVHTHNLSGRMKYVSIETVLIHILACSYNGYLSYFIFVLFSFRSVAHHTFTRTRIKRLDEMAHLTNSNIYIHNLLLHLPHLTPFYLFTSYHYWQKCSEYKLNRLTASYFLMLLSTLSHEWCMQMLTRLSNFRIDYGESTDNALRIIDKQFHFVDDGKKKSFRARVVRRNLRPHVRFRD